MIAETAVARRSGWKAAAIAAAVLVGAAAGPGAAAAGPGAAAAGPGDAAAGVGAPRADGRDASGLALVSSLDARDELTDPTPASRSDTGGGPGKAFLLSFVVPGGGQLASREKRGYAYLAAEIALWAGFLVLNDEGLDERDAYEGYADDHWDFEGYSAWYDANCSECGKKRRADDYACRPLAEYGTQEYYEDIGKYDTYWGWWSESGSGSGAPEFLDVRNDYWDMRIESNRHLRQARYSLTAVFLNHIVSGMDSFLSGRRAGARGRVSDAGRQEHASRLAAASPVVRFDTPEGGAGLRCALVVSY